MSNFIRLSVPRQQSAQANSIIVNATEQPIAAGSSDACYITPIRNQTGFPKSLYYNPATGEIAYADTSGGGGGGGGGGDSLWKTNEGGDFLEPSGALVKGVMLKSTPVFGNSVSGFMAAGLGNTANGSQSVAMGYQNNAGGNFAFSAGYLCSASGTYAVAMGNTNIATGGQAFAMGFDCTASNTSSVAMGYQSLASAQVAFASGIRCSSTGDYSFTTGSDCSASALQAVAMGFGCTASNTSSVAMGHQSVASGQHAFAAGYQSTASHTSSAAIGSGNTASGEGSTALGQGTTASGLAATSTGLATIASGVQSFAEGFVSTASGDYSVAMGYECIANDDYNVALGNLADASGTCGFMYRDVCGNKFCFDSGGSSGSGKLLINDVEISGTAGRISQAITTPLITPDSSGNVTEAVNVFAAQPNSSGVIFPGVGITYSNPTPSSDASGQFAVAAGNDGTFSITLNLHLRAPLINDVSCNIRIVKGTTYGGTLIHEATCGLAGVTNFQGGLEQTISCIADLAGGDIVTFWLGKNLTTNIIADKGTTANFFKIGSTTKTFVIPYPGQPGKVLRHACVEAPTRGTNIYEYQINVTETNKTTSIDLPPYFKDLNSRPRVYVSPTRGFNCGGCGGYVNEDLTAVIVETEKPGTFNIMVTGIRKDPGAIAYSATEMIDEPIIMEDVPPSITHTICSTQ